VRRVVEREKGQVRGDGTEMVEGEGYKKGERAGAEMGGGVGEGREGRGRDLRALR
jgi:hypothetical protein